jgi:serine/threonine-protein kinase
VENYQNRVLGERYEIQELIGVGGMAVVYKAFDLVDKRTVAIKILKEEYLANEEFRCRFKNESKAIAVLAHPNIVKVYDVSFGDDLQYIVMEHVEGITLKEYIQRQKIVEWKEAVHFTVQILRALQHAHDKGIIHRDIKPQNIILLPNASIKVMDFGIARFNRGESLSVADSGAIGSVHYVSPEQARGDYTDEKSDIYSVGVVLYEMITGRLPFESDSDESVALMQVREDAVRPSELNASIPVGLEQITLRAMQKNPADRYQSAAEFLLDLDEFKRNPQIKFDYSYFIDQTPTKFIDRKPAEPVEEPVAQETKPVVETPAAPDPRRGREGRRNRRAEDRLPPPVEEEEEDDDDDYRPRNITIPILIAIAICLVLIVGVVFLAAFGDTIREVMTGENSSTSQSTLLEKIDIFGWFNKDQIEVPNFLNMKYDDVLAKYPDLIIDAPQYEYNSSYADGHVCNQSPEAGEKVSKDTIIKLTVATSGEMILVRDVTGYTAKEAEAILTGDGLTVMLVAQVDETKDEGVVLSTNPAANKYIARDDIVYVYYASSADEVDALRVPDVVGYELEAARSKLEAEGLKVGSVTTGASSASMEGLVINQTPVAMSQINSGAYVNLVVGSGKPSANTLNFTIPLPNVESGSEGTLTTVLNGSTYDTIEGVSLDGSNYELSFTGTGSNNTFKIYIDSVMIYSGNIDFTVNPPAMSNLTNYGYSVSETIPDVTDMSLTEATETLNAAGFFKLHTRYQNDDSVPSGDVISQSPDAGSSSSYNSDTVITLIVSTGSGSGSYDPGYFDPENEIYD